MKTILLTLALTGLCAISYAEVRKWTSADDTSKTFEGEMTAAKGDTVTIKTKAGKVMTLPLAKLSQEDKDYVAGQAKAKDEASAATEAAGKLKTSEMAKAISGKTLKLDGKKLKKHDVFTAKAPEYYLLYWGASW